MHMTFLGLLNFLTYALQAMYVRTDWLLASDILAHKVVTSKNVLSSFLI